MSEQAAPTVHEPEPPPLTQQPWKVLGIGKATWYRLPNRPAPVEMGLPGEQRRSYYRVADLLAWVARLPPRRTRRQRPQRLPR